MINALAFLALVLRTWKVRILFVTRSKATASQSKINDVTPSLVTYSSNKN